MIHMMRNLEIERLTLAAMSLGIGMRCLRVMCRYANERQAFGRTIADFQNTRFKLAEIKSDALMLRVFVDKCIELLMRGELSAEDAAVAKLRASEIMSNALDECLQLFGGYGYMWEYPIARAWADNRFARIAGGSSEIMKEIIGRSLTGKR